MQLKLTLQAVHQPAYLPFNYQYPLSAAIYKIIQSADHEFAAFLHDKGYGKEGKSFKLFTFSDIKTPFLKSGDRMLLRSGDAEVIICFYVPQAAENFLKGLFLNQHIQIADAKSKTTFLVVQVERLPEGALNGHAIVLQPLSPLVVGKKNSRGHYDYRSPEDADFTDCLLHNWLEKYKTIYNADELELEALKQNVHIAVRMFPHPPQQRLITIKGGAEAETKIRGYTKFRLEMTAPKEMMELALGAGLGLYNAQGMGCVGVVAV